MNSLSTYIDVFFKHFADSREKLTEEEISCLQQVLRKFCLSGKKEDAFSVYFCFCEIFKIFGTGYDNISKLLEILYDFEYNAGSLLIKHRDHYSHSVYVFATGLAIYAGIDSVRNAFSQYYNLNKDSFYLFLYLWGFTALFHDVGYPFEIVHDSISTYTMRLWGDKPELPFVSFSSLDNFIQLDFEDKEKVRKSLNLKASPTNLNELFSLWLKRQLSYDETKVLVALEKEKMVRKYQDHAYFSAILLMKFVLENNPDSLSPSLMDAICAILLHNSKNRFNLDSFAHKLRLEEAPIAYLLVFSDNLQDWDRQPFGIKTKADPQAWNVRFDISNDIIKAEFVFSSFSIHTPDLRNAERKNRRVEKIENGEFIQEIYGQLECDIKLECSCICEEKRVHTNEYASQYNFVNLCDFAKSIHASYMENCLAFDIDYLNKAFSDLSLTLKLSNIEQAKTYPQKLELINCFFSDKALDYPIVYVFNEKDDHNDELEYLAREEHVRWVKERLSLGWKYGMDYIDPMTGEEDKELRNKLKQHRDLLPYDLLDENAREKDRIMIRNMIPLLYRHADGTKIYRYRHGIKPVLEVMAVGHRKIIGDIGTIKNKIKEILIEYDREYRVVVRSSFAPGADQLVMECASELGLTTKANIPLLLQLEEGEDINDYKIARRNIEAYIKHMYLDAEANNFDFTKKDEVRMLELLSLTSVCHINADKQYTWMEPAKHMINKCDRMIALWDGVKTKLESSDGQPINRGGTYHCICMAKKRGLTEDEIKIIHVER
ncbi:MAG TPA: hypothetical protein IAA76_06485 [Candidatus Ornithospirochaeta stercorigallinarum]|nr:hypothetical protein [Candidatus Ornithospirochaeta stercorigallinarum]